MNKERNHMYNECDVEDVIKQNYGGARFNTRNSRFRFLLIPCVFITCLGLVSMVSSPEEVSAWDGAGETWSCSNCGRSNYVWEMSCNDCGQSQ